MESGSVALNTLHCALTGSDQEQSFNFYRPIPTLYWCWCKHRWTNCSQNLTDCCSTGTGISYNYWYWTRGSYTACGFHWHTKYWEIHCRIHNLHSVYSTPMPGRPKSLVVSKVRFAKIAGEGWQKVVGREVPFDSSGVPFTPTDRPAGGLHLIASLLPQSHLNIAFTWSSWSILSCIRSVRFL